MRKRVFITYSTRQCRPIGSSYRIKSRKRTKKETLISHETESRNSLGYLVKIPMEKEEPTLSFKKQAASRTTSNVKFEPFHITAEFTPETKEQNVCNTRSTQLRLNNTHNERKEPQAAAVKLACRTKCSLCHRDFKNDKGLKIHVSKMHKDHCIVTAPDGEIGINNNGSNSDDDEAAPPVKNLKPPYKLARKTAKKIKQIIGKIKKRMNANSNELPFEWEIMGIGSQFEITKVIHHRFTNN